jgi:hypothetical protein
MTWFQVRILGGPPSKRGFGKESMDENLALYQHGLALSAGMLDGFRRAFVALLRARREHLTGSKKPSPERLDDVLEFYQAQLIHLRVTAAQMRIMSEAEDLRRVLVSMLDNELATIQAFLYRPQEWEESAASTTEDMQVWLLAYERLCARAGMPDDPIDE